MFTPYIQRLLHLLCVAAMLFAAACQNAPSEQVLRVGASPVPHDELLRFIAPRLAEAGFTLRTVVMQDYVQPNLRVDSGDLDANFFQTRAYFDDFKSRHRVRLVDAGGVHSEPFALYSAKYTGLAELPQGARVAVPADASNQHRAVMLLARAGLVTLPPIAKGGLLATRDIQDNPRQLRFLPAEAAMMPHLYKDVDVAGINANFAMAAGLKPGVDGLLVESGAEGTYVNIVAVHAENIVRPAVVALMEALRADETREFMARQYNGAVVAAD